MFEMKTKELIPHPLNEKVYGKEGHSELLESIRTLGILEPIVFSSMSINEGDNKCYVLSGIRRLAAAKELKIETVPAREVFLQGLEAERFLIESNRQRVKTKTQRLREYKRLKEIEAKFADERKKENLKRGTERPVSAKLRTREEAGRAIDKAAATAGLKPRTAEKGLSVLNKADAGDPKAQALMESIDREEVSIDRAYRELKAAKEVEEGDPEYEEAFTLAALDEADEYLGKSSRAISTYPETLQVHHIFKSRVCRRTTRDSKGKGANNLSSTNGRRR